MFEFEHIQLPLRTVIVPHSFFCILLRIQPHYVAKMAKPHGVSNGYPNKDNL
jgi:hypothetical protein